MNFETYFAQRFSHVTDKAAAEALRIQMADVWDNGVKSGVPSFAATDSKMDDSKIARTLSELVAAGASIGGITLACQLLGAKPCGACGFRDTFCRCEKTL